MIIKGFMMEKESAIKVLDWEINVRYDTGGKIHKPLDFVVGDESYIHNTPSGDYRKVHVEGYFPFGEDLELIVTADGKWDCKETKDKREKRIGGVKDYNTFQDCRLSAVLQTDEDVYVGALKKLEFPWEQQFEDGKLIMDGYYLPCEMFTQIRLLGLVGVVQEFLDPALDKELEKTQKQLESRIAVLRLHEYPVEYQTRYEIIFNPQDGGYDTVLVAKAQYADSDTGIGFEVVYYPMEEAGRRTYFRVDIPCVVPDELADEYCRICGVGNMRGLDDMDIELLSGPNYLVTDKEASTTVCFFYDVDTFLQSFRGWNAVIRILKHGKPERLESNVSVSD